jgi:hypothetical protein
MTLQTAAPIEHLSLKTTYPSARELVRLVSDGLMTADPPYQRGRAWEPGQRVALIESWLSGTPIPAVIVNDRDSPGWYQANGGSLADGPCYAVIDGKQRIETAAAWFAGRLAVPASWFRRGDVTQTEDTGDGPYVRYPWLSRGARTQFAIDTAHLPQATAKVATIEDEARIYLRVNGAGTPQTAEDLARAAGIAANAAGSPGAPRP